MKSRPLPITSFVERRRGANSLAVVAAAFALAPLSAASASLAQVQASSTPAGVASSYPHR